MLKMWCTLFLHIFQNFATVLIAGVGRVLNILSYAHVIDKKIRKKYRKSNSKYDTKSKYIDIGYYGQETLCENRCRSVQRF